MQMLKKMISTLTMDAIGNRVFINNDYVHCKARDKHIGPFPIIQVHKNGVGRFEHGHIAKHISIWRLMPYFE